MKEKKIYVTSILIHFTFITLIVIAAIIFPLLWIDTSFSGSGLGLIISISDLIVIIVLVFLYSKWRSHGKIGNLINKRINIIISILSCVVIVFAYSYFNNNLKHFNYFVNIYHDVRSNFQQKNNIELIESDDMEKNLIGNKNVSTEWTEVNHKNFWSNTEFFAHSNYDFANIKFFYPATWDFACCGDMGHGSAHLISSQNNDSNYKYIKIFDYSLLGCSDGTLNCSLDKQGELTSDERYYGIIENIPKEHEILSPVYLKNLDVESFVYHFIDEKGNNVESYIINTGTDIVEVSFVKRDEFTEDFVLKFLDNIYYD